MKWFFWKIEKNNKSSKSASHTHTPHQRVRTEWRLFKFPGNHRRKSLPCQIRSVRRGWLLPIPGKGWLPFQTTTTGRYFKRSHQLSLNRSTKPFETIVCARLLQKRHNKNFFCRILNRAIKIWFLNKTTTNLKKKHCIFFTVNCGLPCRETPATVPRNG